MIGKTLAHYQVTEKLGAGGMGEVYRARDTRLNRDVALKFLPAVFANDPERMARFEREAQLLASLNHSNIAAIYGFENAGGIPFLVLEYVPGETLKGPLGVVEALEVAEQLTAALEEAHGKGVVHRDLKPANIKVTPDGKVKVLDFGLAKALADEGPAGEASANSPTMSVLATRAGTLLGTAAYMSPEQARGGSSLVFLDLEDCCGGGGAGGPGRRRHPLPRNASRGPLHPVSGPSPREDALPHPIGFPGRAPDRQLRG